MAKFITVSGAGLMRKIARNVDAGREVVRKPLAESRGEQAIKLLRFGNRGISDQFKDQTEYKGSTATAWARGHDFGKRKASRRTMQASGAYRTAWLGGAGGSQSITAGLVEISVDRETFPQVAIHQGPAQSVTIHPRKKAKGGKDWAMRFYLGLTYGVWLKKETLAHGLTVLRRRLSVSQEVRDAVAVMVASEARSRIKGFRVQTETVR